MQTPYDLEQDGGWTSQPAPVAEPTGGHQGVSADEWRESYMPRRSAQVAKRQGYQINPVNGHSVECACPACPGWYEARARMAVAAQAYAEPVVKERQPRPLTDQVVPVSILMVVFTICAVVLLPVVTPMLALGAVSLALVAVSLVVVVTAALGFMIFVMRARREVGTPAGRVVRGNVLKRR